MTLEWKQAAQQIPELADKSLSDIARMALDSSTTPEQRATIAIILALGYLRLTGL